MIRVLWVTIRVRNQEEALHFYTETLGLEKRADFPMGPNQRWVTVASRDDPVVELVLQPTDWFEGEECQRHDGLVGKDPTIVFQVDDCQVSYEKLSALGVKFSTPPTDRPYGIEAVGQDLYGNALVFLQLTG
jgi:predicted enzyme related to lactoylglutathione lyase